MTDKELIKFAMDARKMSHSPYSDFKVGAALLSWNGVVYQGCNIESASYSPTNCAERTAFFKAVSEGEKIFRKIAIVGWADKSPDLDICFPCGVCRQVMAEFCDSDFEVILADSSGNYKVWTLDELLPRRFGPENLL